jgi:hypothetical protein
MRPSLGGGAGISQTVRHPSSISATPTFPVRFDGKPPKIASSPLFGGHLKTEGVIWPYPFSFGTFEKKGDLANRSDAANTRVTVTLLPAAAAELAAMPADTRAKFGRIANLIEAYGIKQVYAPHIKPHHPSVFRDGGLTGRSWM